MPKLKRPILLALIPVAASGALAGCGDSGPDPSISAQEAAVLSSKLQEIESNVAVGSCLVAADKTDDLLADIGNLPSSVNDDVRQALDNGANNLKLLLADPTKCESRATTTQSTSTTESTTQPTRTRTQPTTTTTPTQTQPTTTTTPTQTQPSTTTGGSGGIGPGGL